MKEIASVPTKVPLSNNNYTFIKSLKMSPVWFYFLFSNFFGRFNRLLFPKTQKTKQENGK